MKKDILTLSRFLRKLTEIKQIGEINSINNINEAISAMSSLNKEDSEKLYPVLSDDKDATIDEKVLAVSSFVFYVANEHQKYFDEIERRKKHAINLGIYAEDSEEQVLEKELETKDLYKPDNNISYFYILTKNGIDPLNLELYEAFILAEQILCEETNKSSYELVSMIEEEKPAFAETIKKIIRHANFYAFALDINNDVANMYQSVERKRREKSKK